MTVSTRLNYYRRVAVAYLTPFGSHLHFWHEPPEVNPHAVFDEVGEYYMPFERKAKYKGPYDKHGVPMLNYRGALGLQYNPIAIAQYGLGNYNLFRRTHDPLRKDRFLTAANWLLSNQERNAAGLLVWNHHFDWEYRTRLKAPWYSGLAQGQGISVLVRAYRETGDVSFLQAAERAFETFLAPVNDGGVTYVDEEENSWFEEYITSPPTHILNGFIWASWGVFDYYLATRNAAAKQLFDRAMATLACNLHGYDAGFWSLYEKSGTRLKMLASPFYHALHVVQLRVLHRLTGKDLFLAVAKRWETYQRSPRKRARAFLHKAIFKLCYY